MQLNLFAFAIQSWNQVYCVIKNNIPVLAKLPPVTFTTALNCLCVSVFDSRFLLGAIERIRVFSVVGLRQTLDIIEWSLPYFCVGVELFTTSLAEVGNKFEAVTSLYRFR